MSMENSQGVSLHDKTEVILVRGGLLYKHQAINEGYSREDLWSGMYPNSEKASSLYIYTVYIQSPQTTSTTNTRKDM